MPNVLYPWDKWFLRVRFTIVHGKDYDISTATMAQQVRNAAYDRGIKVSIDAENDRLIVTNKGAA